MAPLGLGRRGSSLAIARPSACDRWRPVRPARRAQLAEESASEATARQRALSEILRVIGDECKCRLGTEKA